jgi:predicted nucleotidyltransferase
LRTTSSLHISKVIDSGRVIRNEIVMDEVGSDARLREIASRFSELEHVEAVVLAGSAAVGTSDSQSDYDFYVYSRQPVDVAFRDGLLRPRAQRLELHRTFWEDEDAWIEPDDTELQIMYRACAWTEGELTARLDRCEASLGYTTAICYSMERSRALWDRSGWFAHTQRRLLEGYPEGLARAIVQKNLPVLGAIISSYEQQIQAAFLRQDLVSLNHRVAAWLSSYFDILFAGNRKFHPGEKRLLAHVEKLPSAPESMVEDVRTICSRAGSLERCIADHLVLVRRRLQAWLESKGAL